MRWLAIILAAGGLPTLLAGCSDDRFCCIDPYPIALDVGATGIPRLGACVPELRECETAGLLTVVIDTATPVTLIDPGTAVPDLHVVTVELNAPGPTGPVPRARFSGVVALETEIGQTGLGAGTDIDGVIGGDVLTKMAMRLDIRRSTMRFFPDIAGSNDAHAESCDAVLPIAAAGGGHYTLGGGIVSYPATRMVVGVCLAPDAPSTMVPPTGAGADALLVLATGLETTVLTRSVFRRSMAAIGMPLTDAAIDAMFPAGTLHLPGSPDGVTSDVRLATLPRIALAADEADNRGPCMELLGNRRMTLTNGCQVGQPCHCESPRVDCPAGAAAEVLDTIDVAIISDTDPTIQAIRDELRPGVADIDGFLGMNALAPFILDVDYPHSRLMFRCSDEADLLCTVRPRVANLDDRQKLMNLGCFQPTP